MIFREYTIIFPICLILQNQNDTVLWLLNEKGFYLKIYLSIFRKIYLEYTLN